MNKIIIRGVFTVFFFFFARTNKQMKKQINKQMNKRINVGFKIENKSQAMHDMKWFEMKWI